MTTPSNTPLWLTQSAHQLLQAELDELSGLTGSLRQEVEARIHELKGLLRRSEVGDKPDDGLVEPGMRVSVQLGLDAEPMVFLLADRALTSTDSAVDVDVYSPSSPLGAAIAGKRPGDGFKYTSPSGKAMSGTIIEAVPFRE